MAQQVERKVPRFARTRADISELLQLEILKENRSLGGALTIVTAASKLDSRWLHKLVPIVALENRWRVRDGEFYPQFDSARPLTLSTALDYFEHD